ncbi:MAG: DEAD/DEAH box helicase, partial [Planctomycetes bacterium]|nr:DEAD/DEAH box helicase [Planctomycetota bacterium]
EADRMHDMGFIPQIRRIIAALPTERQTMMFTATMPADVEQIARRSMRDPVKILAGPASRPVERAQQTLYHLQDPEKVPLLLSLLRKESGRVLVFVRTKRGVDRLARRVVDRRFAVARLHGDREQNQRDEAMAGFRQGRYRVLIATDIAARGLDVADIEHVINFDFPRSPEDYIHRIGRTARLAADGRATSFVTPKDRGLLHDLERMLGSKIPLTTAPGSKVAVPPDAAPGRSPAHGRPHTAPASAHGRSGAHGARAHDRSGAHGARAHDRSGAHGARAHDHSGAHGATASAQASAGAGPGRRRRRRGRGRGGARPVPQGEAAVHQAEVQAVAPVEQPDARPAAQDWPGPDNVAAQPPENGWPAIARFGWELAE